jgi:phasin family protein
MSTLIRQQLLDASSTGTQQMFAFVATTFGGIEKMTELNLQVVKVSLAENQAIMAKALSGRPEELLALSTSLTQPAAEKMASYGRHVHAILAGMQDQFTSAAQAQVEQYQRDASGLVANLAKQVPSGSASGVSAWTSSASQTSTGSEAAFKAAREEA